MPGTRLKKKKKMYPELYSRKTPSTQYSFHYVLQNHYFVPYFRSPVWDRLLLGGKSLKGLKATAHRVLPSKPFVEAVLRGLHTVLRHGMLTGERISRVGCEGAPPPPLQEQGPSSGTLCVLLGSGLHPGRQHSQSQSKHISRLYLLPLLTQREGD